MLNTTVVVTSETPKLSLKLSVISVPTMLIVGRATTRTARASPP
jgi:hypothetical protein